MKLPIVAPRLESAVNPIFILIFVLPVPKSDPAPPPAPVAIHSVGTVGDLQGCPTANDPAPFLRTPRIELIGPCRDSGTDAKGAKSTATTWKHTFHRAAQFSIPRYGQQQQPINSDGLLIYEGMTLTVNPETGIYDLNFTATSPPTPVTIRLQLQFSHEKVNDSNQDPIRLTLPPITIESDPNTRPGEGAGTTLKVNHRGYTELFLSPQNNGRGISSDLKTERVYEQHRGLRIDAGWKIIRAGSARFGSGSANADDSNR